MTSPSWSSGWTGSGRGRRRCSMSESYASSRRPSRLRARRRSLSTSAARRHPIRRLCPSWSASASTSSAWPPPASAWSASGCASWTSRSREEKRRTYSVRLETQPASASRAAGASSPSALSRNTVPPVAPNASTARMLLASATLPFTPTVTRDRKRSAVLTNAAAGRACSATEWGRAISISELACTTGLFGCTRHVFEILSRGRHHCRRDRALDKRRIDEPDVAVAPALFQQVADGEDRTAQVGEHHHPLTGVGTCDRAAHGVVCRPQSPIRATAGRLDAHLAPGQLGGQSGQPPRELKAVGDQYNPDQIILPLEISVAVPGDGRSLHYRQQFSNVE